MKTETKRPGPAAATPWDWHRRTLRNLRAVLAEEHAAREMVIRTPGENGGTDFVDKAADATLRNELLAELSAEEVELTEIDAALCRIELGTYGVCERTGRPISKARLRAIPWTRFAQPARKKAGLRHTAGKRAKR